MRFIFLLYLSISLTAKRVLKVICEQNDNDYISTTKIACTLLPSFTFEIPISNGGKFYKQNAKASSVMNWLKRLAKEGRVETRSLEARYIDHLLAKWILQCQNNRYIIIFSKQLPNFIFSLFKNSNKFNQWN
jgi:hypothetical protein